MSEITPGLERTRGTLLHSRELSHAKSRLGKSTSHVYHVLSSIRLLLHWDTIPRYDTIWMRSHIIIKPSGSWQKWVSTKCSISRRHFNNNNDDVTWNRGVRDRSIPCRWRWWRDMKPWCAWSKYPMQVAKMNFGKILDLTADVLIFIITSHKTCSTRDRSIPRGLQKWVSTKSSTSHLRFYLYKMLMMRSHKPIVRAIEISHAACKQEFRRNSRSHSGLLFIL